MSKIALMLAMFTLGAIVAIAPTASAAPTAVDNVDGKLLGLTNPNRTQDQKFMLFFETGVLSSTENAILHKKRDDDIDLGVVKAACSAISLEISVLLKTVHLGTD